MNTLDWLIVFCEGVIATCFFFAVSVVVFQPLDRCYRRWRARRAPIPPHGHLPLASFADYRQYDVLTHQPCDVPEYQPQHQPHSRSSL